MSKREFEMKKREQEKNQSLTENKRLTQVSFPELAMIAVTRAFLGGGVALLLSERLESNKRKAVGWTLLTVGALSTIPLAFEVFGGRVSREKKNEPLKQAA